MSDKSNILGVMVDKVTMDQAILCLGRFLRENKVHTIFTPNAEIVMAAQRDPYLKEILNSADLMVADGAGVVLGAAILGDKVPQKVPGYDLVKKSFDSDLGKRVSYYLFGGKPGIAEIAASNIKRNYPSIKVAGIRNGYFSPEDEPAIIENINASGADILLVALGAPKQERWIYEHRDELKVRICIGVGGTLDILSGNSILAPDFLRNNGFEWLYRLYKEPWRYKRMMDLPRFVFLAMGHRLGIKK